MQLPDNLSLIEGVSDVVSALAMRIAAQRGWDQMRFFLLLCAAMVIGSEARAQFLEEGKISVLSEIVVNAKLVSSLRQGLANSPRANDKDAYFKKRAIALPDEVLTRLMATTYGDRMSMSEAKRVAEFYRSPLGHKLIAIQTRNPAISDPSYSELTPEERGLAQQFFRTPEALAFRNAGRDPAFFPDLTKRIQDYIVSHPER